MQNKGIKEKKGLKMLKKVLIIGILLILSTGFAVASEEIFGLVVTVVDGDNNIIQDQYVLCERTVNQITYTEFDYTDINGEVGFGASAEEAYYYLDAWYDNYHYEYTVWKPWGQKLITWQLTIPQDED